MTTEQEKHRLCKRFEGAIVKLQRLERKLLKMAWKHPNHPDAEKWRKGELW